MKAILEFNLPEEFFEHQDALNGYRWKSIAQDMNNYLRNLEKHGHSFGSADESIAEIRHILFALVEAENIFLD